MDKPSRCRVAVLVSGGGTNLQALLDAAAQGKLPHSEFVTVISSRPDAYALKRAEQATVPTQIVDPKHFPSDATFENALLQALESHHVDVICLAGFLRKLGPRIIGKYRGRILNIHPALLPKYGGAGMYGHFVHEAVLEADDQESGCTVHLVDEEYDHGTILAQVHVPVLPEDTAETLAARVLQQEHKIYPATLNTFCQTILMKDVS